MVSSSFFPCLSPSLALKILHLPILTPVVRSKSLLVVFLSWQRRFHSLAIADKHITSARTFHHKQAAPRAAAWSYLPILLASRMFMQEPHHSPKYYRGSALAWSRSSLIFYHIKCLTGTVSFCEAVTHIYDNYFHSSRPIRFTKLLLYLIWWQYNASAYSNVHDLTLIPKQ